jgi:uncharacterized protein (TIGR02996 family)
MIAAIRAAPDDDGPRLIYADWLVEQGDPRGEFIQLDCRMASAERFTAERRETAVRRSALLEQHRAGWLEPLAAAGIQRALYHRGFVERISLRHPADLKLARELAPVARFANILESLSSTTTALIPLGFDGFTVIADQLRELQAEAHLRELEIHRFQPYAVEPLIALPCLRSLEKLVLRSPSTWVSEPAATRRLADALAELPALRELEVSCFGLPSWPSQLRRLTIHQVIHDFSLTAVPDGIERLRVTMCDLRDAGVEELTRSRAPKLRELTLLHTQITYAGAKKIAAWSAPLVAIDVGYNRIGSVGATALAARPALRQLGADERSFLAPDGVIVIRERPEIDEPAFFLDELDFDLRPLDEARLARVRQDRELEDITDLGASKELRAFKLPVAIVPFLEAARPRSPEEQAALVAQAVKRVEILRDRTTWTPQYPHEMRDRSRKPWLVALLAVAVVAVILLWWRLR